MKRDYGIDVLKILSMFFVVIIHIDLQGGILGNTIFGTANDYIANFIEISGYCAVNVFVLCTGYLYCDRKRKLSNIVNLWFMVFFYSVGITFILLFLGYAIAQKEIITSFFPVLSDEYWFFTQYFALFMFISVLNRLTLNKQFLLRIIVLSIFLFAVFAQSSKILIMDSDIDLFKLGNGYSFLWFCVLYLIGAYIKKYYRLNINKNWYLLSYFIFVFMGLISYILINVFQNKINNYIFIAYDSVLILFCAVSIFLYFSQMRINNIKIQNFIVNVSSLSFAVYIIHTNPCMLNQLNNRFGSSAQNTSNAVASIPWYEMVLVIIGIALGIFIACIIIEYFRSLLFKFLHIKELSNIIVEKITNIFDYLFNRLNKII